MLPNDYIGAITIIIPVTEYHLQNCETLKLFSQYTLCRAMFYIIIFYTKVM